MKDFRWNDWNRDHATRHGVSIEEIQRVVRSVTPRAHGDGKYLAVGRGDGGRWVQVIYLYDPEDTYYVIHARPLKDSEKRQQRKRK